MRTRCGDAKPPRGRIKCRKEPALDGLAWNCYGVSRFRRAARSRKHHEGRTVGRGDFQDSCEPGGDLLGGAALIGFDLANGAQRAADPLGQLGLSKVERLTAAPDPGAERRMLVYHSLLPA